MKTPRPAMLLLPLLIYWAPRPMQFGRRTMRSAVASVVMIALMGPLCALDGAAMDRYSGARFESDDFGGSRQSLVDEQSQSSDWIKPRVFVD
ncbi:hypothetical protein [Stieleria varia]|uniref:Uncharacterized protein n=1 Tax=Stieleria varia TaxID=2528005 RepID=A0A5C5ZKC5_9BACT|nr:hypothetical protein [Stieleria varia]TWT87869.1 hypothetical protein Pla52n_69770 [Stieleria varia]